MQGGDLVALFAWTEAEFLHHTAGSAIRRIGQDGVGLAAIAGELSFRTAKAGVFREMIAARTDPTLFAMSYDYVGDLAETIAQVLPGAGQGSAAGLAEWVEQRLLPLRGMSPLEQALRVGAAWDELDAAGREAAAAQDATARMALARDWTDAALAAL